MGLTSLVWAGFGLDREVGEAIPIPLTGLQTALQSARGFPLGELAGSIPSTDALVQGAAAALTSAGIGLDPRAIASIVPAIEQLSLVFAEVLAHLNRRTKERTHDPQNVASGTCACMRCDCSRSMPAGKHPLKRDGVPMRLSGCWPPPYLEGCLIRSKGIKKSRYVFQKLHGIRMSRAWIGIVCLWSLEVGTAHDMSSPEYACVVDCSP